jgi:xanthine/uracil permease
MLTGLAVTVSVAVALRGAYEARALALANACGIIVAGGLLLVDIHRRIAPLRWGHLAMSTLRVTALSVAAVAAATAAIAQMPAGDLLRLATSAIVAGLLYLGGGWVLRAPELRDLLTSALRRGDDG